MLAAVIVATALSQTCSLGQYFNGQHCQLCAANCYCLAYLTCDRCASGYTLDPSKTTCLQCPSASPGFAPCTSCCSHGTGTLLSCTDCDDSSNPGFVFLVAGRCLILVGCFQINDNGLCLNCLPYYFLSAGSCFSCHASCLTCLGTDSCLTCSPGNYHNSNVGGALCQACPTSCSTCASSTAGSCSSCLAGYFLLNGDCLACSTGCSSCLDGSFCSVCLSTHLYLSGACYLCTDSAVQGTVGCLSCANRLNFVYCTSCSQNYLLLDGKCVSCSSLVPNSVSCSSSITATQCANDFGAVLSTRYYLLAGRCVLNTNNCLLVRDALGFCQSCYDGYLLQPSGVCQQCSVGGCLTFNTTTCACSTCNPQYYLSGVSCLACIANCAVCPAGVCSSCIDSYYLAGTCLPCSAPNCATCPANSCTACLAAFFVHSGVCYSCAASCLTCTSKGVCVSCASYYLLKGTGCMPYALNCAKLNQTDCVLCNHGYFPDSGLCKPCIGASLSNCSGLCEVQVPQNITRFLGTGLCLSALFIAFII